MINRNCVLVVGKSAGGKSASLRTLKDPKGVIYLNCEAGKELPFADKFRKLVITNPLQVEAAFIKAETDKTVHTIIVDTITFLMDMYESKLVLPAANTMKGWQNYGQFWKTLMQERVAESTKNVIMLAHTMDIHNELDGIIETVVKVKGATMNQGVEAYFCNVIAAKKMAVTKLESYKNSYLTITPEEKALGFKYVYQTNLTKETVNERIRGPLGLWDTSETFIDNDAQLLLDHLHKYYT